jgi:hypothetical protein
MCFQSDSFTNLIQRDSLDFMVEDVTIYNSESHGASLIRGGRIHIQSTRQIYSIMPWDSMRKSNTVVACAITDLSGETVAARSIGRITIFCPTSGTGAERDHGRVS